MRVAAIHRYPVKSMLGERLEHALVGACGIDGDRVYGVVDRSTGLVASAKQPRRWGALLECSATTGSDGVVIALPDGRQVAARGEQVDALLSRLLGRDVTVAADAPVHPRLERLWPDVEGLAPPSVVSAAGTVTPFAAAAPSTFFDYAPLHLITTGSLQALHRAAPAADIAARRFRPNLVVEAAAPEFAENEWAGRRLRIGDAVEVEVLTPTPRCAVPAARHGTAPADIDVLRAVVAQNRRPLASGSFACLGVYARVLRGGLVRSDDPVHLLD